jgi:hypothetical protein
MKALFLLAALLGLSSIRPCQNIFGLSLNELIGLEKAQTLFSGERPVSSQFRDPVPRLLPQHDFLMTHIDVLRRELDPNVMVETLYLYRKPQAAATTAWTAAEEAALFNRLVSLSTLAGLQYYSASRSGMRTFYEISQIIDSPIGKKPLPDPVFQSPPAELSLYVRQKDLSFGDNIYQYDFYHTAGAFIFIQQNLTSLSVGIIPAVGKSRLRSVVAVLDAGDSILVYAASMAKTVSIPGMNERIGTSFANRAEAILLWFSNQADKVFFPAPKS